MRKPAKARPRGRRLGRKFRIAHSCTSTSRTNYIVHHPPRRGSCFPHHEHDFLQLKPTENLLLHTARHARQAAKKAAAEAEERRKNITPEELAKQQEDLAKKKEEALAKRKAILEKKEREKAEKVGLIM